MRLKDILETEVDEKYYINNEKTEKLISQLTKACAGIISEQATRFNGETEYANTLLARDYKGFGNRGMNCVVETNNQKRLGGLYDGETKHQAGSIWDSEYIAPTVDTMQGGNRQPCVLISQATKQGYIECNIPGVADLSFPDSKTRRGRVQDNGEICPTLMAGQQDICYIDTPCIAASRGRNPENPSDRTVGSPTEQRLEINQNGTSNTITTVQKDNYVLESNNRPKLVGGIGEINFGKQYRQGNRIYDSEAIAMCLNAQPVGNAGGHSYLYKTDSRIRKLTPLECWRLMGFTDEQFYKAEKVNSNSQLYKQAGNSIVVDVLYYLFKNLFIDKPTSKQIIETDQLPGQTNILDFIGGTQ